MLCGHHICQICGKGGGGAEISDHAISAWSTGGSNYFLAVKRPDDAVSIEKDEIRETKMGVQL